MISTNPAALVPLPKQHEKEIIRLEPNEFETVSQQMNRLFYQGFTAEENTEPIQLFVKLVFCE